MPRSIIRVWANRDTCLFHEACQTTLAFEMHDGRVMVAKDVQKHFAMDREGIIDAVMSCPTGSLFIEFDDGKVVSAADHVQSRSLEQSKESLVS